MKSLGAENKKLPFTNRGGYGSTPIPSLHMRYNRWYLQLEKRVESNPHLKNFRPFVHHLNIILAFCVLIGIILTLYLFRSMISSFLGVNDDPLQQNNQFQQPPLVQPKINRFSSERQNEALSKNEGLRAPYQPEDSRDEPILKEQHEKNNMKKLGRRSRKTHEKSIDDASDDKEDNQKSGSDFPDNDINVARDAPKNKEQSSENQKLQQDEILLKQEADFNDLGLDNIKTPSGRQNAVKNAFLHAWNGYKAVAFGHDEIRPVSNKPGDSWQGFSATLIDSLDTMIIMGLDDELEIAREFVEKIDFYKDVPASFFEFTIRYVGGLLGAHSLSGDKLYLRKATELADRLMHAFPNDGSSPFPRSTVNLKTTNAHFPGWNSGNAVLSEIGSCQLEFAYLSHHTGNETYNKAARNVFSVMHSAPQKIKGLYPVSVNPNGQSFSNQHITLGGLADSFYEYLLKLWILTDKKDSELLQMYLESAQSIEQHLVRRVLDTKKRENPFVFIGELDRQKHNNQMEHLQCFVPGMFALGASNARNLENPSSEFELSLIGRAEQHLNLASELVESCASLYWYSSSGLAPETIQFSETTDLNQRGWWASETKYMLRPETVESLFVLYRITGEQKYRNWGWEIFKSIEYQCRTPYAFSGLRDVTQPKSVSNWDDSMQSFFLAETLKYLYLLFSDPNENNEYPISLDEFVFTTEAHPLKILK